MAYVLHKTHSPLPAYNSFLSGKEGPFPGLSGPAPGLSWIRFRESPFRLLGPGDKLFSFCRGTLFCLSLLGKRMLDSVHSFLPEIYYAWRDMHHFSRDPPFFHAFCCF
ncbi:hypothetical protein CDAR_27951 [Caerostris darwini]|uniref:Uncharacterized protein n=1 Tax=Caerostris darwini TaxID=1538125 RepID=A0AAV4NH01_9ARAC|nr:hypothetical protein CDAR_302431 [Caerostris darwini]GIX83923.1 hypothetical protein CDAR_27951 [Caerostris darwini]